MLSRNFSRKFTRHGTIRTRTFGFRRAEQTVPISYGGNLMTVSLRDVALPAPPKRKVIVTTISSDSHTWNLVFLQLLLEEMGHEVINLGSCVPDDVLVDRCLEHNPDLIVVSSVNGHGYPDGKRVIEKIRKTRMLRHTPAVIGGKLGVSGELDRGMAETLVRAGFDAVFQSSSNPNALRSFVDSLPARRPMEIRAA